MNMKKFWLTIFGLIHVTPSHAEEDVRSYRSRSATGITSILTGQPGAFGKSRIRDPQHNLLSVDESGNSGHETEPGDVVAGSTTSHYGTPPNHDDITLDDSP